MGFQPHLSSEEEWNRTEILISAFDHDKELNAFPQMCQMNPQSPVLLLYLANYLHKYQNRLIMTPPQDFCRLQVLEAGFGHNAEATRSHRLLLALLQHWTQMHTFPDKQEEWVHKCLFMCEHPESENLRQPDGANNSQHSSEEQSKPTLGLFCSEG